MIVHFVELPKGLYWF